MKGVLWIFLIMSLLLNLSLWTSANAVLSRRAQEIVQLKHELSLEKARSEKEFFAWREYWRKTCGCITIAELMDAFENGG